eukprot:gene21715-biopygen4159
MRVLAAQRSGESHSAAQLCQLHTEEHKRAGGREHGAGTKYTEAGNLCACSVLQCGRSTPRRAPPRAPGSAAA